MLGREHGMAFGQLRDSIAFVILERDEIYIALQIVHSNNLYDDALF